MLKRLLALLPVLAIGIATPAVADHDGVVRFATLPKPGPGLPEGIAADHHSRIFVSTFTANAVVHIFDRNGKLDETISLPAGVLPLGLEFDAKGNLYVADFANGDILKFRPPFNSGSVPTRTFYVCGGMGAGCGLNAITFDKAGNLYVSDSFGGDIFRIGTDGKVITFIDGDGEDAQGKKIYDDLKPGSHGFPPFGANGLAFDAKEENLYIANTADDRILKYNLASNTLTRFAESINGADGIAFDYKGRLWVAANQGDELVALNSKGRIIERVGSFRASPMMAAQRGCCFPRASC